MTSTMKANRNYKMTRDDRAEVGVGTLIVFIAMVLVAAVAAAVLINTSGTLQERAQATGKEATEEVSSNLKVVGIYGERNSTTDDIYRIKINVELSAGAPDLDLTQLVLRYSDGVIANTYNYDYGEWVPSWIRGTNESAVMESGDLVELRFDVNAEIVERTEIEVLLIPESGTPVFANFETPPTYGTSRSVTLR